MNTNITATEIGLLNEPKNKLAIFSKIDRKIFIKFQKFMESIYLNKTAQMTSSGK
jgi:hypothetical protein